MKEGKILTVFICMIFIVAGCSAKNTALQKKKKRRAITATKEEIPVARDELEVFDYLDGRRIVNCMHVSVPNGETRQATVYLDSKKDYVVTVHSCYGQSREMKIWITKLTDPDWEEKIYGFNKGFFPEIFGLKVSETGYYVYHVSAPKTSGHEDEPASGDKKQFMVTCIDVSVYICEMADK